MIINPRESRDIEELIELCTDSYDIPTAPLQMNHDYLRHVTESKLSHKARKLLVWLTHNIVRRNFVLASVKQLANVIEDSKHLSKYLKELEEKRLLYIIHSARDNRLIEIHPALAFKGWNQRREQYIEQWLSSTPIYKRQVAS